MHPIPSLVLFGALLCPRIAEAEELPAVLNEAFVAIDTTLSDEVRSTLKKEDPEKARIDPFGDDLDDITNEETYDSLRSQLVDRIKRRLGLGQRNSAIARLPTHPKVEEFFVPYLVTDPGTQADILLELYVKQLRGLPTGWKERLIQQRALNVGLLKRAWEQLMSDLQAVDPAIAVPLLREMKAALGVAEKQIVERVDVRQSGTNDDD